LLTAASLESAAGQGMHIQQLLQLIEKEQPGAVPDGLRHLSERWTRNGVEAGFERVTLLRFKDKAACAEFIKAAGTRLKLEQLTPQVIVIQSSQQEGVRRLLAELGILAENEADV
jgi:hypothetical protein